MESVEDDVMLMYLQSTTLWNGCALRNQWSHVFDHAKWKWKMRLEVRLFFSVLSQCISSTYKRKRLTLKERKRIVSMVVLAKEKRETHRQQ